jgi:hypothetical protein
MILIFLIAWIDASVSGSSIVCAQVTPLKSDSHTKLSRFRVRSLGNEWTAEDWSFDKTGGFLEFKSRGKWVYLHADFVIEEQ